MSILLSIGTWFIKLASSELVKSILTSLIPILIDYVQKIIPLILDEIKRASSDNSLNSSQKFDQVYLSIKMTYPELGESVLRMLIEVCYTFFKSTVK